MGHLGQGAPDFAMPYKDPEKEREKVRRWRKRNLPQLAEKQKNYYNKNKPFYLYHVAKSRAKRKGLPFTIDKEDVRIPEFCPILGIKLERGDKKFHDNSPSLDQIIPNKGYTKDNVMVISFRANRLKGDGSIEELEKVLAFLKEHRDKHAA